MARVVYVEDEPDIAELVRRWLAEDDHEFIHARDGTKGLDLIASAQPDLVLLDINLGEFSPDGWEVNRRLKDDPRTKAIPVIALTAHAQWSESRDRALREGFVEHVSKPFNYDCLLATIQSHLPGGAAR
jgi:two-component system cell cycle response regulator DivK